MFAGLRQPEHASIRPRHLAVLAAVGDRGTRPREIAATVGVTPAAVTQALNELEAAGFVTRVPDVHDRRAKIVVTTPKGGRLTAQAGRAVAKAESRFRDELGARRVEDLRDTLERIESAAQQAKAGRTRRRLA